MFIANIYHTIKQLKLLTILVLSLTFLTSVFASGAPDNRIFIAYGGTAIRSVWIMEGSLYNNSGWTMIGNTKPYADDALQR